MASPFGLSGGPARCYGFWQDFQKCYAQADRPSECIVPADDYYECLHGRKEIARTAQIQSHWEQKQSRQLESQKREREATVSGIMALGLARREREDKERQEGGGKEDKEGEGKEGEDGKDKEDGDEGKEDGEGKDGE